MNVFVMVLLTPFPLHIYQSSFPHHNPLSDLQFYQGTDLINYSVLFPVHTIH